MAREKGGLLDCLNKSKHHVSFGNTGMIWAVLKMQKCEEADRIKYRMDLIRGELQTAISQVEKIKKLAKEKGLTEVLAILNEEIEFGHDFLKPQETPEKPEPPPIGMIKEGESERRPRV